jgi:Tol biopolymer transport system component
VREDRTMLHFKRSIFLRFISLIFIAAGLTSCIEVELKESLHINKDGSGETRLEILLEKSEIAQGVLTKIKHDIPKGWNIIEEKDKDGKHVLVFGSKFNDISAFNRDKKSQATPNIYTFKTDKTGLFKKSYALEVSQTNNSDMPFPYEITIKMPGKIDETNGTKVSSNEVKWNLQGFRKGTKLIVKSSAFTMPDYASLKEAFNKAFNKMFYREAIVFLRDNNLWVMDGDGKNDKQLTKEKVKSFSVSRDGKRIVYEEKGNCYYLSLSNSKTTKLTDDDNCLSAEVSPDGEKIALVKIDERFSNAEAQELVSKGYSPEYMKGSPKKTGIYIFDFKTGEQKKVVGELPSNLSPDDVFGAITECWLDSSLYWSPDGNRLHFIRNFMPYEKGGMWDAYIYNLDNGNLAYIDSYSGRLGIDILDWHGEKIIYNIYTRYIGHSYIYDISSKKKSEGLEEFYRYSIVDYLDRYGENVLFLASDYSIPNGILFIYDVKTSKYKILAKDLPYDSRGAFSPDGKKIVYGYKGNLWTIDTDGKNKKQFASNLFNNKFLHVLLWNLDGKKMLIDLDDKEEKSIWHINSDGSNLEKLADNASSPKWTSMPRITFISPNTAKIIILVAISLTGLLLLFGMVLITRKAVKAVVTKIPKSAPVAKTKGIFCTQCGKENSDAASFCTGCGQRLKE